jgi:hypothetical protein
MTAESNQWKSMRNQANNILTLVGWINKFKSSDKPLFCQSLINRNSKKSGLDHQKVA